MSEGVPSRLSGVLSADVQLPLRDVNSFGGRVSTGGYHGSKWREGDRRVEEAVLGEPRPFGGGHQRLEQEDSRQCSVSPTAFNVKGSDQAYYEKRKEKVSLQKQCPRYCDIS